MTGLFFLTKSYGLLSHHIQGATEPCLGAGRTQRNCAELENASHVLSRLRYELDLCIRGLKCQEIRMTNDNVG